MVEYDTNPQSIEDYLSKSDKIEIRKRLFGKTYIYSPTSSVMKMHTIYIEAADADRSVDAIKVNPALFKNLHRTSSSNCRLQILLSNDHQAAIVQMSRYVPHTYEPRINPVLLTGEQVALLLPLLNS